MTIAVLWYRQKFDELWCASDSRISCGDVTMTDSGPKILPVPVICHKAQGGPHYSLSHTYSFGFAFAGSTLSAISTHALVTACTQNLATAEDIPTPPRLAKIADLFRAVGEHYISEISARVTGATNPTAYFFEAFIYGFCPVMKAYQGFAIAPNINGPTFKMRVFVELSGYFSVAFRPQPKRNAACRVTGGCGVREHDTGCPRLDAYQEQLQLARCAGVARQVRTTRAHARKHRPSRGFLSCRPGTISSRMLLNTTESIP